MLPLVSPGCELPPPEVPVKGRTPRLSSRGDGSWWGPRAREGPRARHAGPRPTRRTPGPLGWARPLRSRAAAGPVLQADSLPTEPPGIQARIFGLPFPSPGDLPDPGIEPASPELAGGFFTTKTPGKPEKGGTLSKSGQGTQDLQDREYKQGRRLQSSYESNHALPFTTRTET